ncbi:MAG: DUF1579 family protein [Gammaproteobacteria bacterium]|jgi:hypothetical protein|nr:DUF1579 family protein [Gammaproteobacteria bacterium]
MKTSINKKILLASIILTSSVCLAQSADPAGAEMPAEMQAMMEAYAQAAKTGKQHAMLAESVGEWTAAVSMWMDPSADPMLSTSSVNRTMTVDGRVLEEHWQGNVMGQPFMGLGRTGYDNVTGKYWSTWTDNMSTALMVMYGNHDTASNTYSFSGEYFDPLTKQPVKTRSELSIPAPGQELMTMFETRDGTEIKTMQIELQRK